MLSWLVVALCWAEDGAEALTTDEQLDAILEALAAQDEAAAQLINDAQVLQEPVYPAEEAEEPGHLLLVEEEEPAEAILLEE